MIAQDLAAALDPLAFSRQAGIDPDPWQADVLRSTADQLLLNCSRQAGKSTIASVLALHTAQYYPPALVLLLSPSLRQSQELFRKVLDGYRLLDQASIPADAESALRLELANGSRIIALPGKEGTIRGYSGVKLLVIDEASRVADGLYYAVRPMLAVSGGRLIAMSTPAGKRGWWFEQWTDGHGWERVEIHADQCPRIPAAFLAKERQDLPGWVYEQEYEGVFHEAEDAVFRHDDIAALFDPSIPPLFPQEAA